MFNGLLFYVDSYVICSQYTPVVIFVNISVLLLILLSTAYKNCPIDIYIYMSIDMCRCLLRKYIM